MKIAIAGFGVAGGALATLLARAGHEVTVFERASQPGPVGAGFLLHSSGQSVLRGLGLLEGIMVHSARLSGLEAFTHRGRRFSPLLQITGWRHRLKGSTERRRFPWRRH